MATEKQIEANKQNALQGGVNSEAGKKISRLNAVRHGFFSKIVTDFDKIAGKEFSDDIYEYFSPSNVYEAQLVEILLSNLLAFRRICLFESQLLLNGIDKAINGEELKIDFGQSEYQKKFRNAVTDEILKIKRYKICAFNMITKAQHELERLTRMRNGENVPFPAVCDVNISAK